MLLPNTYRKRTQCPECHAKVRLESVNFLPKFQCPNCGKDIRVSKLYQRTMSAVIWPSGLATPYLLGATWWVMLLCWIPCVWVLGFLWTYAGKYMIPPKLESCKEATSVVGLGLE